MGHVCACLLEIGYVCTLISKGVHECSALFMLLWPPQDFTDAFQDAVAGRADLQGRCCDSRLEPGSLFSAAAAAAAASAAEFTQPTT